MFKLKNIIIYVFAFGVVLMMGYVNAYSFLDIISFYWGAFGEGLAVGGLLLTIIFLFMKREYSRFLVYMGIFFLAAGLLIYFFHPKQYSAEVPEGVYLGPGNGRVVENVYINKKAQHFC